MTSTSSYHYVESSSRLLCDENEEEEDTLSLDESADLLAPQHTSPKVAFFHAEDTTDDQQQQQQQQQQQCAQRNSLLLLLPHQAKRNRTTSLQCSKEAPKAKPDHDQDPQIAADFHKRRTNSLSERQHPHSSLKRMLLAGKQIQHSLSSAHSHTPILKKATPHPPTFNRSQSDSQHHDNINRHSDSYTRHNASKLNFLSSSFDDNPNQPHLLLHTPASVAEESLSSNSSSSTSQSSTPSSCVSKSNRIVRAENEEQYSLLAANSCEERERLFDDNNNLMTQLPVGDLVRMGDLKLSRSKNDSIRMRNYSSAAKGQLAVDANRSYAGLLDREMDSSSSDDGRLERFESVKENASSRRLRTCFESYFVITVMFLLNLLNYIDRYTLAGVLGKVQDYFKISDSYGGLLQTVFVASYMLLAPLFGYLGDRYPRKWLIVFGITFWSAMTLAGSFVPANQFWLFAVIRGLVGIGEASYSCVAPTIIGDLFNSENRTRMLAIFYLAVPVGSGMGYIFGSKIESITGNWQWALRITPMLGAVCVFLLIFFVKEPKRGGAEGSKQDTNKSSVMEDFIYLWKNRTFIWITLGFTFATFVLGGLSWWVPTYVEYAIRSNNQLPDDIPIYFGVITCIAGLFGVVVSSTISPGLRRMTGKADPLLCAFGSLVTVPTLFILILVTRDIPMYLWWALTFVAISAMCLSWTVVADILLYTIHPTKRSIASAINILVCHLFGDAFSPYLIGAISDALQVGKPDSYFTKFKALQFALYAGPVFAMLSFAAYLFAAIYVEEDKKKVELIIKKSQKQSLSEPSMADKNSDPNLNAHLNEVNDVNENNAATSRPVKSTHNNNNNNNTSNQSDKNSEILQT